MGARTIAQRELRNNIGEILRDAQAGTEFTITVRGRPVARLGPPEQTARTADVDAAVVAKLLLSTPVDDAFAGAINELRQLEAPAGDPWSGD